MAWLGSEKNQGLGRNVELVDRLGPLGQPGVFRVQPLQVVDVPQQMGPAPLLQARVVMVSGVEIADQHSSEGGVNTSSTTPLPRPRRRKYRSVGVLKVQT